MLNPILNQITKSNNPISDILNNPQFKQFVEENKNLSVDQIAKKYNINIDWLKPFLK